MEKQNHARLGGMTAAQPAGLRDDELHQIASAIIAGPLTRDRDERWRQAAILDELLTRVTSD